MNSPSGDVITGTGGRCTPSSVTCRGGGGGGGGGGGLHRFNSRGSRGGGGSGGGENAGSWKISGI